MLCWSRALMWTARCTATSCHWARWPISEATRGSWDIRFSQCARSESCSRTDRGCFARTMHPLTSFWTRETYRNNLTIYLWFFLFPKFKVIIKETCFEGVEVIKWTVRIKLRGIPEEIFQQWGVGNHGKLYSTQVGLLRFTIHVDFCLEFR